MKLRWNPKAFCKKHRQGLFIGAILFAVWLSVAFGYRLQHRDDPTVLGVSYSIKYADELGIDWQKGMLALMDEIGVKHFRLMSYWDLSEKTEDEYEFDDLDWQFDQAERHEATVSLAIGQRQPRWPECHIPEWAKQLDDTAYEAELMEYIRTVVERYKDSPALESYQVENEAANNVFGDCEKYDPDLLERELKFVRELDPDTTIITNASSQNGHTIRGPVNFADKVGFTIYHNAHFEAFGNQYGWRYLFPSHWHSWKAGIISGLKDVDIFIHELQAEPWGPEATVNLSSEEQDKTMNPEQLRAIINYSEQTGIKEMYLWGAEWWYWRLNEFGDKELWGTVKDIFNEAEVSGHVF